MTLPLRHTPAPTPPALLEPDGIPAGPAYHAVLAAAGEAGWPRNYQADLYQHDRATLADNPELFIWILRESGTRLLRYATTSTQEILEYDLAAQKPVRTYLYQHGRLALAGADELRRAFAALPAAYTVEMRTVLHTDRPVPALTRLDLEPERWVGITPEEYQDLHDGHPQRQPYWDSRVYHDRMQRCAATWKRYTGR